MTTESKAKLVKDVEALICVSDIIDDIVSAVSELPVEEVFNLWTLETWAEENGYVKEE